MKKAIFTFLVFMTPFFAQAFFYQENVYTVRDVKVSERGDSAAEAQELAMKQAKRKAFKMLLEEILPDNVAASYDIPDDQLEEMIDSIEVNHQQNSRVSYQATMTIHFEAKAIEKLLGAKLSVDSYAGLGSSTYLDDHAPLLVVPIYIDQGSVHLWGDQNPWLYVWANKGQFNLDKPVQVPLGDLQDVSLVNGQQILRGEFSSLKDLARRYSASGIVVAVLKRDNQDPKEPMAVDARLVKMNGQILDLSLSSKQTSAGEPEAQFAQAMGIVLNQLAAHSEQVNVLQAKDDENRLTTFVEFQTMRDWFEMQNALQNSKIVRGIDLKSISRHEARLALTFRGSLYNLESDLSNLGLQLEQVNGQAWLLRRITKRTSTTF